MSETMWFQRSHSRNGHDFHYTETPEGRHVLTANREGVRKRIGLLITALTKFDSMTKQGMADYLCANFHESFTVNDISQPIKRMVEAGIVKPSGSGRGTYYTLTSKGKDIWSKATKKFQGDKRK